MKNFIIIQSLLMSLYFPTADAGCLDGFKAAINRYIEKNKRAKIQTILAKQYISRIIPFKKKVKAVTSKSTFPLTFKSSQRFIDFVKIENVNGKIGVHQEMSKILWRSINEGSDIINWAKGLQRELYSDAFRNAPYRERILLKHDGIISKTTLLRVLKRKYLESNIFDGVTVITRTITEENFGFILQSNKIIIDRAFKDQSHGEFIHALQVDMMFTILKANGFSKAQITEFYRWLGGNYNNPVQGSNKEINPLGDVWTTLFDSLESNLGKPELLNPMLLKALGLR